MYQIPTATSRAASMFLRKTPSGGPMKLQNGHGAGAPLGGRHAEAPAAPPRRRDGRDGAAAGGLGSGLDADAVAVEDEDDEPEAGAQAAGPPRIRVTQCISTQVGCAMGCTFCE
jgi:hypothetical protein